ncbi:MAG: hypothetical protein WKF57_07020 [Nakamurella sp.]
MDVHQWWPQLSEDSRRWLTANNGDVVPPPVVADIARVVGGIPDSAPWLASTHGAGLMLSDTAVDWIEAAANDEY